MRIDFHTHSSASDGGLSPVELLCRAAERNLALFAITDHDTVAGYRAAAAWAEGRAGLPRLVPGVEFSSRWSGAAIHIVGLGMECDHPAMREGLAQLEAARRQRGERIAACLEARGFAGALDGALCHAGNSQLGRPHFAAWLVEQGHVKDANEAFDKYLGRGKPGDVKAYWPEMRHAVRWIVMAGGVAVIAHPLKYEFTRMKLRRLVVDFVAAGGGAVELDSGSGKPSQAALLLALAREFSLQVSVGSDFHREGPYRPDLGVELPRLAGLEGVWRRFLPAESADPGANTEGPVA